jgi:tetratricopeptide (TPR) repeat protein
MKKLIAYLFLLLCFTLILPILFQLIKLDKSSILYSQTKDQCTEVLNKAQQEFDLGHFQEAINLIDSCLNNADRSETDKATAYRLLGLVYIADNLKKEADEAVKNLLIIVPNYKVDPEKDPPLLEKKIDEWKQKLKPTITAINPNSIAEGEKGFKLTVTGDNFVYGSKIHFNGSPKPTEYVSKNELRADISDSDIQKEGNYIVLVYSPIMEGKNSNTEVFNVNASSNFPWTWVAAGAGAVAAAVAIILLGGDDDGGTTTTTLAEPPGRP